MLQRGAADDRKTSLRVSLDLSLAALNPPSAAHRLIRLMALLPDGMSEADSRTILNDSEPTKEERSAGAKLESARLLSRPDGRWRVLAPIRETLLGDFPPDTKDRAQLIRLFLKRAALGKNAGRSEWGDVSGELTAEAGNLDVMIGVSLREISLPQGVPDSVSGLAEFHRFTGLASTASLPAAVKRFQIAGDGLGEAICIRSLGDIALRRSDLEGARVRYEAALLLYRQVGAVIGEANCLWGLGDIALYSSNHESARHRYEEALPLYRQIGDVLGEANCITRLGDIALEQSDHEGARRRYKAAILLYQQMDDVLGEANCITSLGDIALGRSDHEGARRHYEAAMPLYLEVGDVVGQANCIQRLGDIEEAKGNILPACEHWREALYLYVRSSSPYSIGSSHWRLARRAATPAEANEHREAAQGLGVDRPAGHDREISRQERVNEGLADAQRPYPTFSLSHILISDR
jgi:tetratricopeptide (TPR) repeat protein